MSHVVMNYSSTIVCIIPADTGTGSGSAEAARVRVRVVSIPATSATVHNSANSTKQYRPVYTVRNNEKKNATCQQ